MNKLLLLALLVTGIISCTTNDSYNIMHSLDCEEKPLEITTKILTTKSASLIQQFKDGIVIGLHITNGNVGSIYNDKPEYRNVRVKANQIKRRLKWQQTPIVFLCAKPAKVFAYYPYQSQENFDAAHIPVYISPDATQTNNYMYGTQAIGQKAITNKSPYIMLNMNHALSLIAFEISLGVKGTDPYKLKYVQIGNKAGGTALHYFGTMDISTGKISGITKTNASTRLELNTPVSLPQTSHSQLQIKVIPTINRIKEGDIEALFNINGHTFKYLIPAHTKWEKGNKYLYKLSFNGKAITLKEVTITEWIPNGK